MVQPLALIVYEKLLPGSQLVNRLRDHGYRTQTLANLASLEQTILSAMPMVVFIDVEWRSATPADHIRAVKANPATSHVPIIAFGGDSDAVIQGTMADAGAIAASEAALTTHLPQLLDRALQV